MAGKRQIGAIIKLDGEQSFKASLTNCKTSISAMKAELKSIQASYSGNANSLEALSAVQNQYAEIQKKAKEQIEKTQAAYTASKDKQDAVRQSMEEMKGAYEAAAKKLEDMKNSGEASADAIEEQSKATEAAYTSYQEYSEAVEKCEARTNRFQKALADAETEETKAGDAVERYSQYIDEAKHSADGAATSIDAYGKELKTASEAAADASENLGIFSGVLSANLVTDGLQKVCDLLKTGAEYVVEVGSNFEAAMSQVEAVSGAAGADLDALNAKAQELGRSTVYSASDAANALYYMALAGWNSQQMLASIDDVLNLAASSGMDLAKASDIVTDEITAFGLKASDAAHFVDVMSYAQSHANTTAEDLGEAYKEVASTAGRFNISVEEVTSALMVMANSGVKGSTAGNALNTVLSRVMTNTKDSAKELKKYGVEIYDSTGKMKSMSSILIGIADAFSGLTEEEQANLAKIIAGQNQYTSFMTILTGMSDAAKESGQSFEDYTAQLEKCDGTAEKMADTMQDNLKGKMKALESAAEGLGNALYDYISGPLSGLVEGVTDAINGITDEIKPATAEIKTFADTVSQAAQQVEDTLNAADMSYSGSKADASKIQAYLQVIEDARNKTSLTSYETFQLKNAVTELSGSIPELNQYIDDTNGLLQMSAADFSSLKMTITQSYRDILAEAVIAKRQAYMIAKADAEISKKTAADAMAESKAQIEAQNKEIEAMEAFYKRTSHTLAEDVEHKAYLQKEKKELKTLQDAYDEAADSFQQATDAESKATAGLERFEASAGDYKEQCGIIIDENGNWTTATQKLTEATDEEAESLSATADAAEEVSDSVSDAVDEYTKKLSEMANADLAERVRDQLTNAASEIKSFQDTIQGTLSSVSLFGDRSSLVEAYTSTNRDEMKRNMSWSLYAMKTYTEEMQNLQNRGVSKDFIDYLAGQGEAGLNYVHSLSMASDEELKQFEDTFAQYQSYASGVNENVQNLMKSYGETILDGITEGREIWYKYGTETTEGLFDAINQAAAAIKTGAISGTIEDALQVVFQTRYNAANQPTANAQTQNNFQNAAMYNAQTQTTAQARGNSPAYNYNTHDTLSVDLTVDGEVLANRVIQIQRQNGKITGRR